MAQARNLGWSFLLLLFTASPLANPIGSVFKIHLELTPFYHLHHHQSGPWHLHFSCGSSPSLLNRKPCFCLVTPPSLRKSLPSIAARRSLLKCQIMWPPCSKPSGRFPYASKGKVLALPYKASGDLPASRALTSLASSSSPICSLCLLYLPCIW